MSDIEKRAREFHDAYERLAPQFGYETRPETREFDPDSPNGRLMMAVIAALTPPEGYVVVPVDVTQQMRDAGNKAIRMCNTEPGMGIADRAFYAWQSMLAARPEVP